MDNILELNEDLSTVIGIKDKNITHINIPESVTTIGEYAFVNCIALQSIYIPNSVTTISMGAFYNCSSLKSIEIPNSIIAIKAYTFQECSALHHVTIPNCVEEIGGLAFKGCTALESIIIPNSVKKIRTAAFYGCSALQYITIPSSVISIWGGAFSGCSALKSIFIPDNVRWIGNGTFSGCSSLKSIDVSKKNQYFASIDGILYDKKISKILRVPLGVKEFSLPNNVSIIGESAFEGCYSLKSIDIHKNITLIEESAFDGCSALQSINVSIYNPNYISLDGVLYDKGLKTIIQYPCGKNNIEYNISNTTIEIRGSAFKNCSELKSIVIPQDIKRIGEYAFSDCCSLRSIHSFITKVSDLNINKSAFKNVNTETCVLYVPSKEYMAYCCHPVFSEFKMIKIDSSTYSNNNIFQFNKDTHFKLDISCGYENMQSLSDSIFKFRKGDKWGLVDVSNNLISEALFDNIVCETKTFLKIQNGDSYGLIDMQGNVIIPTQCNDIKKVEIENCIFFVPSINGKQGAYDKSGKLVVPIIYNKVSVKEGHFYCSIDLYDDISAIYNFNGEHLLYIDDKQYVIIPTEYEYAHYVGYGLIQVSKNCKWGLIDKSGQLILEPKFACIDKFEGSFARVGISLVEKDYTYFENCWNHIRLLYGELLFGFIDTSGDIVLPVEYEEIEKWDNGYYHVRKNGLYGLLSSSLYMVIEPKWRYIKKLDDQYILVKASCEFSSEDLYSLIDYYGNEIIPTCNFFSEVEILENSFLKVVYQRSQYKGFSHIGILDARGKSIFDDSYCDDITFMSNGLFMVEKNHKYCIYNILGKNIFNTEYDYIQVLENGDFLINENNCYGLAKSTGEIYIHARYKDKIQFENGVAKIEVKGSQDKHKIDTNGQVILLGSNNIEIKIPKDYYWGTDFINGISIVRSISKDFYSTDAIGVINEVGDIIIPPKYNGISLLVNNTLLVQEKDCFGLFDINGKCILPDIFTDIEYIGQDRIRVVWNLDITTNWEPANNTCGEGKSKFIKNEDIANIRSTLCDSKGNIICDKNLIYIGKFNNGYARSYLSTCIENYQARFTQVGIIDINGETIVSPEYDRIVLYYHNFALLKKGEVYGIADLQNKKIIMFNDLKIKQTLEVDSYGRLLFIGAESYEPNEKEKIYGKGVVGLDGIIVPIGRYYDIDFMENGLIKVSNEQNELFGVLGINGEELLKMKYSYISAFENGYASVSIGGYYEDEFPYKRVGGKWGIIDETGKFIVNCIHDEKQIIATEEKIEGVLNIISNDRTPKTICSDYICDIS